MSTKNAAKQPSGCGKAPREAQAILNQRSKVTQPYGTLVFYPLDLSEQARCASVEALNQILADTIYLRDMFKKHHWQVSGPTFFQLHLLFEKLFLEQTAFVDLIGERIQMLGGIAVAMPNDVADMTKIEKPPRGREEVPVQISRLVEALAVIIKEAKEAVKVAQANGDEGTVNLLGSEIIAPNEKQVWFLSEHLVDNPLVRAT
jgi:starvation-inducible DNA-binding protein